MKTPDGEEYESVEDLQQRVSAIIDAQSKAGRGTGRNLIRRFPRGSEIQIHRDDCFGQFGIIVKIPGQPARSVGGMNLGELLATLLWFLSFETPIFPPRSEEEWGAYNRFFDSLKPSKSSDEPT